MTQASSTVKAGAGAIAALACVATLFFAWGFVTSVIDPLIASLKRIFALNFAEAMLTQFAWFIAYGVMSLPAAWLLARIGSVRSILGALAVMVAGALLVLPATLSGAYWGVLAALFVIASGVTWLQVAANPLAANIGPPERSHFRLTLVQAFNSLGTVLGPLIGANLLLRGEVFQKDAVVTDANRAAALRDVDLAFLALAVLFAALAFFIVFVRKRIEAAGAATEASNANPLAAFRSRWALAGGGAIFLYVGAEVAIGSILALFLARDDVFGVDIKRAGELVALYWGGALVGRFVGSALLTRVKAAWLLAAMAAAALIACLAVTQLTGAAAGWIAIGVGLANAIMFPTIFTLTLERSSAPPAATSGLLCMAIVGGAVLPYLAGLLVDVTGDLHQAFFIPMLGYAGILLFAVLASGAKIRTPTTASAVH